ncbi:hypothetical protein [Lactobacillus acidophilus]|uniref:hypothetical protein n=1 Tax=Lactobacillus acidophilus TaxID=1579 RepID=UPI0021A7FFC7|nr:hypothetical protein [Lactobacillus acidophilus]
MSKREKTQFAIRKLTTGTGILLLSVGMGINLSSKEVSASEMDSTQTSETIQTEAATESTTEKVDLPTSVQETGDTSTLETTSNVEETTVAEVPTETVTQEKQESAEIAIETEKEIQDTTVTDSTNNENNDAVNTDSQAPEAETNAQPETEKADEDKKNPAEENNSAKDETVSSPEKNESSEQDKTETDPDKKDNAINIDGSILPDATKPDKDNINDIINSILSDPDKLAEFEKNPGLLDGGKEGWLEQYRPTWEQITNKEDFPGWEDIFNGKVEFDRVEHFDYLRPQWQSTTNKDITITQTVNGESQDIKINYDVVIIIKPQIVHWQLNFVIDKVEITHTKYPEGKDEFDAVDIPPAPNGFENKVTGTIEGPKLDNYDINSNINIEDAQIKTDLTGILNTILQKGEDVTFKYDIEQIAIKKPTWTDVIDGDNINKNDWNDIFENVDFIQDKDGNWTGKVTFNKDIIQNINGLAQGSTQTISLTKDITITVQRDGNTNTFKIIKVNNPEWTQNGSLGSADISNPGYNYDVSTTVTGTDQTITPTINGNFLTTDLSGIKLENNNNSVTITYTVNYTPDWSNVEWPDEIDKDKITDWTQNDDGSWSGNTSINKNITQTVNGNSNQIILSQAVTVKLALKDGKWTAVAVKGDITVKDDDPLNVNKPGYTYTQDDVSASIGDSSFDKFTVENGKIVVDVDAWNELKDGDTIKYTVNYKPDWSGVDLPDNVVFEKDPNNPNTWTGSITTNKEKSIKL